MKVSIYARCRDEKNVSEFIQHYFNLGFDHILFLDHLSNPPLSHTLNNNFNDKITIVRTDENTEIDKLSNGTFFMETILPILKEKNITYCLHVDMDEYLVLKTHNNIKEVIEYYSPFDMLKINWLFFGNNNLLDCDNTTLKDKFTKSALKLDIHVKSMANINKIIDVVTTHSFILTSDSIIKNTLNYLSDMEPWDYNMKDYDYDYNDNNVNLYLAHYIVQGTTKCIQRRFGRNTASLYVICDYNFNFDFINFINNNIEDIANYVHFNNTRILENITDSYKSYLNKIKDYYSAHNKNEVDNFDLIDK